MRPAAADLKLRIERPYVEAIVREFPRLASLQDQLRLGTQVDVPLQRLSETELQFIGRLYAAGGAPMQQRATQLLTLHQALNSGGPQFAAGELEMLLPALARYLLQGARHGWLFTASLDARPLAYLVTRLDYVPASNEEAGKIYVELKATAKAAFAARTLRITASDIDGKTIAEILAAQGFVRETPALIADYEASVARYFDWRARYGAQFSGHGTGYYAEDPGATHRDTDWSRKNLVVLSSDGGRARLVNDEGVLAPRSLSLDAGGDLLGSYLGKAAKSNRYDAEDEVRRVLAEIPPGLFTQLPVHPFIFMFHLDLHHHLWIHVEDVEPYRYQPDLKQKLVLPEEQTDLIDILTAEMDVLMDDIVAGKSGGTTVLCAGPAGVGKTLTAEVYSEIIQRPLYRVHSGQLGLNVAAMETALKEALLRAQRWGAVMLIDEADVYIKRRDNDIAMNAVVGVFLRVLEYFNGLLFLTTNRVDDIDEAIVSRCIALIRYAPPDRDSRRRIWQVMTAQFGLDLAPTVLDQLAELFPAATGRDIKGLVKLVAKYCSHKRIGPSIEVVKRCSMFRGMDAAPAGAPT